MKRVLCTVAALAIAATAFAGVAEMSPQQVMTEMMNCPVCSVFGVEPGLGPTLRSDVQPIKTGFVQVFMTADQNMVPAFEKAHAECESRCASIPKMTAEQKSKLCHFCNGLTSLQSRKDVTFEGGKTAMGWVTVATSTTPEGTKALHEYAAMSKQLTDKLTQASKDMSKEPMKSKM